GADRLLPYSHPPFEALAVAPFMGLPYSVVYALWALVSVLLAALSLRWLLAALPIARLVGWVMLAAAFSYYPLHLALWLGQDSLLVLAGLCGVYAALKRRREGWAGAALVLVSLKPQLLPAVLLLALQRHWQAL